MPDGTSNPRAATDAARANDNCLDDRIIVTDVGRANARAKMDAASTPLAQAPRDGSWPKVSACDKYGDEIEVTQTPQYLELKRLFDTLVEESADLVREVETLKRQHDTLGAVNDSLGKEVSRLMREALAGDTGALVMEVESFREENARLRLEVAELDEALSENGRLARCVEAERKEVEVLRKASGRFLWEATHARAEAARLKLQLAAMADCSRVVAMTAGAGLYITTDTGKVWRYTHDEGWKPLHPVPGTVAAMAATDTTGAAR